MRVLLAIPLLILLVAFALSNQQSVLVGLWPTDIQMQMPLSVAVLIAGGLFFVIGAFVTWTGAVSARGRTRAAERRIRQLQAQVETLRARPATAMLPPP